jgi:hypothetical protein
MVRLVPMEFLKEMLYGAVAGIAAGVVVFVVGILVAKTFGTPAGASFGVGFEPWNLPGTILGIATFVGLIVRRARKHW